MTDHWVLEFWDRTGQRWGTHLLDSTQYDEVLRIMLHRIKYQSRFYPDTKGTWVSSRQWRMRELNTNEIIPSDLFDV